MFINFELYIVLGMKTGKNFGQLDGTKLQHKISLSDFGFSLALIIINFVGGLTLLTLNSPIGYGY